MTRKNDKLFDLIGQELKAGDIIAWGYGQARIDVAVVKDIKELGKVARPIKIVRPYQKFDRAARQYSEEYSEKMSALGVACYVIILHPQTLDLSDVENRLILNYHHKYATA